MGRIHILDGQGIDRLRINLLECPTNGSSLHRLDPQNVDHLFMRFYVEGDQGKATVRLEMTKVGILNAKLISG